METVTDHRLRIPMARGGQCFEKLRRCIRTVFFVAALVASLVVTSLPVVVAVVDVLVPCVLISRFTCVRCYGFKEHLSRYSFKSSLTDIPLVSIIRSFVIICMIPFFSFSSLTLWYDAILWLLWIYDLQNTVTTLTQTHWQRYK